ncbi:MAG: AI-2E family transporter [Candidatus Spyradosoma sp.]
MFFSPFQQRVISWAATGVAVAVLAALAVGVVAAGAKFLAAFGTVIWPIVIASLLALLLRPVCDFLETRLRLPRAAAIAALFVLLSAVAAGALLFLVPVIARQATELVHRIPELWARLLEHFPELADALEEFLEDGGIVERVKGDAQFGEHLKAVATAALPKLQAVWMKAESLFSQVVAAAVVPIYFCYFLGGRHDLIGRFEREAATLLPRGLAADAAFLMRQFRDIVVAFFRGQFLVVTCYGAILAAGFFVAGLPGAIFLGLALGYLNMIPYFGTVVGLCAILPLAFFSGGMGMLAAVLVVFCVAQAAEAWWLTPKIMERHTGLHPMVIMISIFFWAIALDGVLGMVLAVPLTAFFAVFWRLVKERLSRRPAGDVPAPPKTETRSRHG